MDIGFHNRQDEELEATELRLGLPGTERPQKPPPCGGTGGKRALVDASEERADPPKPTKSQVVGWPPVRSSFRRNVLESKKAEGAAPTEKQPAATSASAAATAHFIKVSMDGAPFLRKVDLNVLKGYKELRLALEAMFKCFETTGSDFSVTYEDKDGDWMLVGDVPWQMFTDSCRRLRIMKGAEARGLNAK